ncbi:hypothetical protein [Terrimonas sp.]|uniref:hypothetical protein n=1 Tax=Terrimonas sp. TaxID=1914338 RepID=UPI001402F1B0|nr:hypothetical protein [Terrimonas sp.]
MNKITKDDDKNYSSALFVGPEMKLNNEQKLSIYSSPRHIAKPLAVVVSYYCLK